MLQVGILTLYKQKGDKSAKLKGGILHVSELISPALLLPAGRLLRREATDGHPSKWKPNFKEGNETQNSQDGSFTVKF